MKSASVLWVAIMGLFDSVRVDGFHKLRRSIKSLRFYSDKRVDQEQPDADNRFQSFVTILDEGPHHLVVAKPPSVICHHSEWSGSRSQLEIPMLQRVREAVQRRVNLVHRLDRGASGCLLLTFADDGDCTTILSEAMKRANKTYVAIVRGEGILHGEDLKQKGWFSVDRPIKNERGQINDATTFFRFVSGQDNGSGGMDRPRASLVLARPVTGRWHQVRRHLNGLSHPILGDSSHGNSKTNREWREKYGLSPERTCLHLLQLSLPPTDCCQGGMQVHCPLAEDMMELLEKHLPQVLKDARPVLSEEGISLCSDALFKKIPVRIDIND
jgi:23S rRNA-/tRNA-specific pseudouridylate synthase